MGFSKTGADVPAREIGLAEKLRFLSDPSSYGVAGAKVEVVETHMSFVFLVGDRVYKFKKPIETPVLNFTTLDARKTNCLAEVALNRRLAPDVYFGVKALTLSPGGSLSLGAEGQVVEWLVVMRRLPEELMLDRLLASGPLAQDKVGRLASRLADFFRGATRGEISGSAYFERLCIEQVENQRILTRRRFAVDHGRVPVILQRMDAALSGARALLEARANERQLIDGHGDLRPEHICFTDGIDIFDCLEFSADLRLTDPVEEIAFLGLECELLGALTLGPDLFARIMSEMGEAPPQRLFHLHYARKGLLRVRLSLAHLLDPKPRQPEKWEPLAARYLALAEKGLDRFDASGAAP
ncbi:hypothetical protein K9U39_05845 [Rhodoblastus acidophilus]|uniref:Aminoglycoside phosphotransferase domain-containing protein n=1 Tax=Candidatus Rhodoblastus alkanivorans TaxID=2954117 RepID=A0ABS9Z6A8_9HYPH|nr:hypothetical protein [Candidatus Rhodoblastus alkanivorans]MCI4683164.1 hypothetical protein [Candidatus Rhodoblastus alkanivorans]MDI4640475.1 hypothetical protein [Rhodoblastus acidophilus]